MPLPRPFGGPAPNHHCRTLLLYVWPAGEPGLRARVVASLALLVGGKVLNIQVRAGVAMK